MSSSSTHHSESNVRRYGKGTRLSSKKVFMYSDYYEEEEEDNPVNLTQRSVSLTTLHPGQAPAPIEPRMAQLETLEAKMASIEVSLSTTPRRKKSGSIGSGIGVTGPIQRTSKDVSKEVDALRNALRDKENMIQSLKVQLCSSLSINRLSATYLRGQNNHNQPLTEKERKVAGDRLQRLRQDMDNKRLTIKNLKMALERLDITDNIDVRIQQAELEYQLGREELNLLTLMEETRNLQLCLEDAEQSRTRGEAASIYNCVAGATHVSLHAIEINYDPKSPRFGAGPRDDVPGLYVEWATEDSGMLKGDRVVEVNGKLVMGKNKEDMHRLLSVTPDPAQIVVLRTRSSVPALSTTVMIQPQEQQVKALQEELKVALDRAEEAERAKDTFISENLRLSHRISYLEEQVTDLLEKTKDEINHFEIAQSPLPSRSSCSSSSRGSTNLPSAPSKKANGSEIQVFQKGPQVTAIVANLPGLDVGSNSPKESRHCLPTLRQKQTLSSLHMSQKKYDARSTKSLDVASDCSSNDINRQRYHRHRLGKHLHQLHNARSTNSLDADSAHGTLLSRNKHRSQSIITDMKPHKSRHSLSDYASDLSSRIDGHHDHHRKHFDTHNRQRDNEVENKSSKNVDYYSESSSRYRDAHRDVRSVKSLDFDSDTTYNTGRIRNHMSQIQDKYLDSRNNASSDCGLRNDNFKYQNGRGNDNEMKSPRPAPPKKPLRLSLQKSASLQAVNTVIPVNVPTNVDWDYNSRKPMKRNHKGEAPVIPTQVDMPSKTSSCQSTIRWPSTSAAISQQTSSFRSSVSTTNITCSPDNENWC